RNVNLFLVSKWMVYSFSIVVTIIPRVGFPTLLQSSQKSNICSYCGTGVGLGGDGGRGGADGESGGGDDGLSPTAGFTGARDVGNNLAETPKRFASSGADSRKASNSVWARASWPWLP